MFKQTKKAALLSVFMLIACLSMLLGTTYAWFTDSVSSGSNVITAGNLDVEVEYTLDGENWDKLDGATDLLQCDLWEPGHTEVVALKITNEGSLALKYTAFLNILGETIGKTKEGQPIKLSEILKVTKVTHEVNVVGDILLGMIFNGAENVDKDNVVSFNQSKVLEENRELLSKSAHYLIITVDMPETVGNEANHNGYNIPAIQFGIDVIATQYSKENDSFGPNYDKDAEYPTMTDTWDGTANTDWYTSNPTAPEYSLDTAEAIAGLAELIDAGQTFEGQTIKLSSDVDLYLEDENGEAIPFDPIGSYRFDQIFKGTFDGQGHTISNLNQNTWALDNGYYYNDCGLGLFGAVEDAVIKNLVMDGAQISGESGLCGTVAAVAHNCTFENITIKNSNVADYQYYAGGIVGWASGEQTFVNCNIEASTTIAAQWGDFDNSIGGVIGGASSSAKILIKDTTVACRIDAYNDVTSSYQWYAYRRAGMLIGNSGATQSVDGTTVAAAPQLTCENVTVIYGDWANYTYCEFAGTSWPYVRVQAGVSNSAYSNPRYGNPTDANGNKVVDDNHVHNAGEDHHILCQFDQLYGGGQGVYGSATHEGVTIIYNNR